MEGPPMADLDRLIDEFKADFEAGRRADVTSLLEQVPAEHRQELAERLDTYLMDAPRRRWDPAAYEGSMAQLAVERVSESIDGVSGTWPELLPQLRNRARIKRSDLVERLAGALGFDSAAQIEKIGAYYHEMEHGTLPSAGVSVTVIEALAAIVGSSVEAIRAAGGRRADGLEGGGTFARTAFPDAEFLEQRSAEDLEISLDAKPSMVPRRDEIDALFLDG
jgi:hypothetical protein